MKDQLVMKCRLSHLTRWVKDPPPYWMVLVYWSYTSGCALYIGGITVQAMAVPVCLCACVPGHTLYITVQIRQCLGLAWE